MIFSSAPGRSPFRLGGRATRGTYAPVVTSSSLTVHFHSDWSMALGQTDAALLDTGKAKPWTGRSSGLCEVVTAASTGISGWPSENVLEVPNDGVHVRFDASDGYIPAVGEGESIAVRFYEAIHLTGGDNEHGKYFDDTTTVPNWGPQVLGWSHDQFDGSHFRHRISASQSLVNPPPASDRYYGPNVQQDLLTVYRTEGKLTRLAGLEYKLEGRIYNAAGSLLYGGADFVSLTGMSPGEKLIDRVFEITSDLFASLRGFRVGQEGTNGASTIGQQIAAVCIANDWPGPYPIAGVEG